MRIFHWSDHYAGDSPDDFLSFSEILKYLQSSYNWLCQGLATRSSGARSSLCCSSLLSWIRLLKHMLFAQAACFTSAHELCVLYMPVRAHLGSRWHASLHTWSGTFPLDSWPDDWLFLCLCFVSLTSVLLHSLKEILLLPWVFVHNCHLPHTCHVTPVALEYKYENSIQCILYLFVSFSKKNYLKIWRLLWSCNIKYN